MVNTDLKPSNNWIICNFKRVNVYLFLMNIIIIQILSILITDYDRKGSNFDTTSLYKIV